MTPVAVTIAGLLTAGVAAQILCVAGVLAMRGPFDKLHYAAAGATLGPVLVGAAVLVAEGGDAAGLETIATVALVVCLSPALTIAIARAARRLDYGGVEARAEERR